MGSAGSSARCRASVIAMPFRISSRIPGGDLARPARSAAFRCFSARLYRAQWTPKLGSTWNTSQSSQRRRRSGPWSTSLWISGSIAWTGSTPESSSSEAAASPLIRARVPPSEATSIPACLAGESSVRPNTVSFGWWWRMSLSLLRVRNDRPRPSRKIASRIEVLPAPFSPAMRFSSGENSSDRGLDAAQVLDAQLGERTSEPRRP